MAAIITATDFTEVADNAVQYACSLASDLGLQIIVIHSYTIPVTFHENPLPVISMDESKSIAESQLEKLSHDLYTQYPQLNITSRLSYGDITDSLKECIAETAAWMVIVGNSSTDDSGFWLGSNLLSTLRHLKCAVTAVPAGYRYKKIEKIAFACDFNNISGKLPAADLVGLVQKTGGELHVLNVDNKNKHFDPETPYEFAELDEALHTAKPQYHYIENEDVDQGIQSFVSANDMDWLVVIPHRHNFFESLFHKSHTKAIVKHAHIPLVALHEKG